MRSELIKIRCFTEEKEKLKSKAEKLGLDLSSYLRWIGSEGKIVVKDRNVDEIEVFKNLVYEINKIGTNINQIAKVCNTNKNVPSEYVEILIDTGVELSKKLDRYADMIFK